MNEVLKVLKDATADLHSATEQYAYTTEISTGKLTPDLYHDLLLKNYYAHQVIEQSLYQSKHFLDASFRVVYQSKLDALKRDLSRFPSATTTFEPIFNFEITHLAHVTGVLYVTEGSMLGGQVIKKLLLKNEQLVAFQPFHFYTWLGKATRVYWKQFTEFATNHIQTQAVETLAVEAAIESFSFFHAVYQKKA
ncbi:MAG: biliverdin-producing heme oxygenase [Bacteroidota bacterium]